MTCDNARPCRRCITRGIQDTCQDAPRKRKKYLADLQETTTPAAMTMEYTLSSNNVPNVPSFFPQMPQNGPPMMPQSFPIQRQPTTNFMSSAADLEYAVLGHMVQDTRFGIGPAMMMSPSIMSDENSNGAPNTPQMSTTMPNSPFLLPASQPLNQQPAPPLQRCRSALPELYSKKPKCDISINQYYVGPNQDPSSDAANYTYPQVVSMIEFFGEKDPVAHEKINKKSKISFSVGLRNDDDYNRKIVDEENIGYQGGLSYRSPSEVYKKVDHPFSYPKYYHQLILYLRNRFGKEHLVSMAKSMAEYRPSFIAGALNLKEDDMIFQEQCFQRTLLEYDNYISISGTPSIVWRRTGQIAYVSTEFCILTGWTKEMLLSKCTFIVELMDDPSVLEYFQMFSKIAFGDFKGATMAECTLLTPNGGKIKTSCIWTLKRDVFGLPMMLIGNFLPNLD